MDAPFFLILCLINVLMTMEELTVLNNGRLSIAVSAHGAELCSLKMGQKEYLWQADPAYWKRHSPVLFPIVGSVWENRYRVDGKEFSDEPTWLCTRYGVQLGFTER